MSADFDSGFKAGLRAALTAVRDEALYDPQPGTSDEAYQHAISDCCNAIKELLK